MTRASDPRGTRHARSGREPGAHAGTFPRVAPPRTPGPCRARRGPRVHAALDRHLRQAAGDRAEETADNAAPVPRDAASRHRARVLQRVLGRAPRRHLRGHRLRRAAGRRAFRARAARSPSSGATCCSRPKRHASTRSSAASRAGIATRSCTSIAAIASSRSSARSAIWPTSTAAPRVSSASSSTPCATGAGSIESKDRYTQGHCERVADLACALALRAGLEPRELFWFRVGAIVHDVGKLIIPSEILNKPGKLAPDEWELIKRHPVAGVEMLVGHGLPRRRHPDGALAPRALGRPGLSGRARRRGRSRAARASSASPTCTTR